MIETWCKADDAGRWHADQGHIGERQFRWKEAGCADQDAVILSNGVPFFCEVFCNGFVPTYGHRLAYRFSRTDRIYNRNSR